MTPRVSIQSQPCPDPHCLGGYIVVHNVYSVTPLKGEEQVCDLCGGNGYLVTETFIED